MSSQFRRIRASPIAAIIGIIFVARAVWVWMSRSCGVPIISSWVRSHGGYGLAAPGQFFRFQPFH